MKKAIFLLCFSFIFQSCIPLRIAPTIKDYQVTKGKRFKRSLPKRQMFIFEDPKEAQQFYNYINTKFALNDVNVYDDIPFTLAGNTFFFAFYEVDIPHKTLNIVPLAIDVLLTRANMGPALEELHETRVGNWYIAIEVYSDHENDCLKDTSPSQQAVSTYLQQLKNEYLTTYNYNEVLFKN